MVFSSVLFLFRFLPIFMICYFLVPRKMKNLVLFLGSLVFYAWGEPVYIFLMLFSTISDYVWGRLIEEYRGKDYSRIFLLCSIGINLFILGFFKYADFLLQTVKQTRNPNPAGEDWLRYEPRLQSPNSGKASIRLRVTS